METKIILIGLLLVVYILYLFFKSKKDEVKKKSYVFANEFANLISNSMSPEEALKTISEKEKGIFSRKLKQILTDSQNMELSSALRLNAKKTHICDLKEMLNVIAFSLDSKATNTGEIISKMSEQFESINELEKQRLQNMLFVSVFILVCGALLIPLSISMLYYFFGPTYSIDVMTISFLQFVALASAVMFGVLREDKISILVMMPLCVYTSSYVIGIL